MFGISGCIDRTDVRTEEKIIISDSDNLDESNCTPGTYIEIINHFTKEMITMEIIDTKVVSGREMCQAVFEANSTDKDGAIRYEYLWSVDESEAKFWYSYDENGSIVSQMESEILHATEEFEWMIANSEDGWYNYSTL
ncbi:hypothetical protein [uncultured Methanolobus sp.]|uniref:hypothetical protein n=1 Tax=uncultured Methanolobus sp. TaxID=218300 RepID=UPI0029C82EAC|nr:hypothetical protein [uncultured Methanolobus sp.]